MHEKKDEIRSYYNANPQKEWDRLKKKHPYEKYITIRMMDRYINPGDRILKYGECIGAANTPIKKGEYVHVHNMDALRGRGDLNG